MKFNCKMLKEIESSSEDNTCRFWAHFAHMCLSAPKFVSSDERRRAAMTFGKDGFKFAIEELKKLGAFDKYVEETE